MIIIPSLSSTLINHNGVTIIASVQHQLVIGDRAFNVPGFDSDTLRVAHRSSVVDVHGNILQIHRRGNYNGYHIFYNGRYLVSVSV